jgi:hypothetical protein
MYLNRLMVQPRIVKLGPVKFLQHPPTISVRQRPTELPGPDMFQPFKLKVTFKRKRGD